MRLPVFLLYRELNRNTLVQIAQTTDQIPTTSSTLFSKLHIYSHRATRAEVVDRQRAVTADMFMLKLYLGPSMSVAYMAIDRILWLFNRHLPMPAPHTAAIKARRIFYHKPLRDLCLRQLSTTTITIFLARRTLYHKCEDRQILILLRLVRTRSSCCRSRCSPTCQRTILSWQQLLFPD